MAYILEKTGALKGEVEALKSQGVSKELVELERDIESFAEERGSLGCFTPRCMVHLLTLHHRSTAAAYRGGGECRC